MVTHSLPAGGAQSGVTKIVIVDDHAAIIGMMTQVVQTIDGFKVVGTALNAGEALAICKAQPVDIVILDLVMPGVSGLALLSDLGIVRPEAKVMIFTGNLNAAAMRGALSAGVLAVVEKSVPLEIFRAALISVSQGQTYFGPQAGELIKELISGKPATSSPLDDLSIREKAVLCHLAQGMSSKEIATKMGLSVHTVINHRSSLMKKTGLRRVAQLSLFAVQSGLIGEIE